MVGFSSEGVDEFGHPIHWGQDSGPQRVTRESTDENNFLGIKSEALARNGKLSVTKVNKLDIGDFKDILEDLHGLKPHRESDQPAIEELRNKAINRIEEKVKG